MSETAIVLTDVDKCYRLFRSKGWRIADALGLPTPRTAAWDFWALRGVTLSINRGERVGLIGRNGAGKSTLLKLAAGLMQPSRGTVESSGRVNALMELGTGFHPDLSGRENIKASLAYLGVTGRQADEKALEVIEFAEVDEFIDQPFRAYSAGMQARLTFTVATSVMPDVLIVDEILGAGDAYFTAKAVARMQELTRSGTTLLFVSHDLSSVQMMCDRAVWIERGRIVGDGDTLTIGKAYMASVRKQEEIRVQAKEAAIRGRVQRQTAVDATIILRLVAANSLPPRAAHPIFGVRVLRGGHELAAVQPGEARDNDPDEKLYLIVSPGYTDWSTPQVSPEGRPYRDFGDERGRYHHAPIALRISPGLNGLDDIEIEIEHRASALDVVRVEASLGEDYYAAGELSRGVNGATRFDRFRLPEAIRHKAIREQGSDADAAGRNVGDVAGRIPAMADGSPARARQRIEIVEDIFGGDHVVEGDSHGTGEARISAVRFLSPGIEGGEDRRVFICGESLEMEMVWQAEQLIEDCRLALAVYRSDGRCATQIVSPAFTRAAGEHKDRLLLSPLRLGPMEYVASVGIFRGLRDEHRHGLDPLHVIDRRFVLKVMKRPNHEIEIGDFLHDATWTSA